MPEMRELTEEEINKIDVFCDDSDQTMINWSYLCSEFKLSEEFIYKYRDNFNFYELFLNQKLSESFLRESSYKIYNDSDLPRYQNLSEEFIEEFKHRISWHCVLIMQNISEEFIYKHKEYIESKFRNSNFFKNFLTHQVAGDFGKRFCKKCGCYDSQFNINCDELVMQKVLK